MNRTILVLVLALLAAGAYPAWVSLETRKQGEGGGTRVLTVAHHSLQSGFRRGFRAVADAYEAENPGVRVKVVEVPAAVWTNWLTTKLVGGMAPDIIQIGMPPGGGSMSSEAFEELLSRHFLPFRGEMELPNPYAAGTPFADVPWRQTFADGLMWPPSYSLTNFEIYGVPFTLFANRLVYNRRLLVEITGKDEPPKDFRSFLRLCGQIADFRQRTGRAIVPIAAARNTGPSLTDSFFGSVTQWLRVEMDPHRQFTLYSTDGLRAAIGGNLDFDGKEIRAGLELVREVGLQCTPGFMQLQRDSAVFLFGQERALMMLSNPVDVSALRDEATFQIGICRLPWPTIDDPAYGRFVMGPTSESQGGLHNSLGVPLTSRDPALAVDFLQFATSTEGATLFARESGLSAAVVVADEGTDADALRLIHDGYPPGFSLGYGRPELTRLFDRHLHHLFSPSGSVDDFVAAMKSDFPSAATEAARGFQRNWRRSIRQRDGVIGAYTWFRARGDHRTREAAGERLGVLLDNDSQADALLYILDRSLELPEPLVRHKAAPVGARRL